MPAPVDPLFDFDGRWTTDLADQYLPDPRFPEVFYECVDGRLIMSPAEASPNGYAASRLTRLIGPAADAAGDQLFETEQPFPIRLTPLDLLLP